MSSAYIGANIYISGVDFAANVRMICRISLQTTKILAIPKFIILYFSSRIVLIHHGTTLYAMCTFLLRNISFNFWLFLSVPVTCISLLLCVDFYIFIEIIIIKKYVLYTSLTLELFM